MTGFHRKYVLLFSFSCLCLLFAACDNLVLVSVRECMRAYAITYSNFVSMICCKFIGRISPNLQLSCSWEHRCTEQILRSRGQTSSSRKDHIWLDKHFGRHFLVCLRNAWTNFNETCHSYSSAGPHNTDDVTRVDRQTVLIFLSEEWTLVFVVSDVLVTAHTL